MKFLITLIFTVILYKLHLIQNMNKDRYEQILLHSYSYELLFSYYVIIHLRSKAKVDIKNKPWY